MIIHSGLFFELRNASTTLSLFNRSFFLLHRRLQLDLAPQAFGKAVEIHGPEELAYGLGTHHRFELLVLLASSAYASSEMSCLTR